MHLYTLAQMRALEQAADAAGHPYAAMMGHAGRAVAQAVAEMLPTSVTSRRVVVLAGPGNNGGDGLVAARELARQGFSVAVFIWQRPPDDTLVEAARRQGVALLRAENGGEARLGPALEAAHIVVDALFGTGLSRPIEGIPAAWLAALRATREPSTMPDALAWPYRRSVSRPRPLLVAVDVPSGLNGETGAVDPATVPADLTVTFAGPKVGMLTTDASEVLGQLVVADIGIPRAVSEAAAHEARFLTPDTVAPTLPARAAGGHKGTFGTVLVVGGSLNYVGAPALSARAVGRSGAGLVTLAVPAPLQPLLAAQPDLTTSTWLPLPHDQGVLHEGALPMVAEALPRAQACVLGPGLGGEEPTRRFVWALLGLNTRTTAAKRVGFAPLASETRTSLALTLPPTVVDADALNALAAWEGAWWESVRAPLVLTPHPGEMARLLGQSTQAVQADRLAMAREAATRWGQVVVLKGAFTVVAAPDGRVSIAPFANPALAKAGSGDVLAGILGALLAQGMDPYEAACLAVVAHGLGGEALRRGDRGRAALASDLLGELGAVWELLT